MSEPPVKIRRSVADDVRVLHAIDQACFPADIAFSHDEIASCMDHPKSIAWVAERARTILGFVIVHIEDETFAHVITLDVVDQARRQKIGTSLMNRMHKGLQQRGINIVVLEVAVENGPARKLYEKLQYEYIEKLPGYYHGRLDAWRMARIYE
jgi:[ribosomal protein S18]-alanine N-acetyltransferase